MSDSVYDELKEYMLMKIKTDPEFVNSFGEFVLGFSEVPENIRKFSENAALVGWFVTSHSYLNNMKEYFDKGGDSLDSYMLKEIEYNYQDLKSDLLSSHDNRSHILKCAFALHEEENWVASIPLFLAQVEGIFSENVGSLLFSEHNQRKAKLEERFKESSDKYMPYLYSPFEVKTQFSAGISSASKPKKLKGPNRNGILHGSRKHLDYGTQINSYKCISLLSYISMVFTKLENKI